ncbi:HAD family phosphatase [Clostridium sp. D43t1_170807_H7]|uniref:HAD family hydrolase n=1 Tax=Clostridium sp. D43t1_170807_H7 TaxID=2787140 RepID=UPI001A9A975A|nr:HAD family phosphatase [Clostridium sp. D43t1_170807_H7]
MNLEIDKIKAVIFDMDGVIFDTEMVYLKVWSEVFEKYGYKMTKEIYASVLGTGRENVKKVFLSNFGSDLPIDDMYIEKDENLAKEIEKGVPLKPGVCEILEYLKENNFKIALATSALSERAFKQLKQANIESFFHDIVCRDEVRETKPNPDIFLKAADKLSIRPEQCIVIEDSSAGIEAAFNAGMLPFHVVDLKKADEKILSSAYKSFNNLNEIRSELMSIK